MTDFKDTFGSTVVCQNRLYVAIDSIVVMLIVWIFWDSYSTCSWHSRRT